jgi:hypothetical protein
VRQLRDAISEERLRLVTLVDPSAAVQQNVSRQQTGCLITIDFNPIREILRKH